MEKNKKYIYIACIIIFLLTCTGFYLYKVHDNKTVPINTVKQVDTQSLMDTVPQLHNETDAKDVAQRINYVTQNKPPTYEYFTYTDAAADQQAETYSKQDKADYIVKTQDTVKPKDSEKNDTTIYENKYYAVNANRKKELSAGVSYIDSTQYYNVSYRNSKTTYTVYSNNKGTKVGAGISYTLWSK